MSKNLLLVIGIFLMNLWIVACSSSETCTTYSDFGGYQICYSTDSSTITVVFNDPKFNRSEMVVLGLAHLIQDGTIPLSPNVILEGTHLDQPNRTLRLQEGTTDFDSYVGIKNTAMFTAMSQYVLNELTLEELDWIDSRLAEVNAAQRHYNGNRSFAGFLLLAFVGADNDFLITLESALRMMGQYGIKQFYLEDPKAYKGYAAYRNLQILQELLTLMEPETDPAKELREMEERLSRRGT